MSLPSVAHVATGPSRLADLLEAVAQASGCWVVVEHYNLVVGHGRAGFGCPAPLVNAIVDKTTGQLRRAVAWSRASGALTGSLGELPVVTRELGPGTTAWFIGPAPRDLPEATRLLALAAAQLQETAQDAVMESLLHPRGVRRPGRAPLARLLVVSAPGLVPELVEACRSAAGSTDARLHTDGDQVVMALGVDTDPRPAFAAIVRRCPSAVAGCADVPEGASDWVPTVELARAALRVGRRLGKALADPADVAVLSQMLLDEARAAVRDLADRLPVDLLAGLKSPGTAVSASLEGSLAAWCRSGRDITAAAASLHVHANTLRYRLKRAEERTGIDLTCPDQTLALTLLLDTA